MMMMMMMVRLKFFSQSRGIKNWNISFWNFFERLNLLETETNSIIG